MTFDTRTIFIRKMKPEDSKEINHIFELITQHSADNTSIHGTVERHSISHSHEVSFVAEIKGKVIGFTISYILKLGFEAEESAYIATMGIHPQYMGRTIGAAMMEKIFDYYQQQGITRVYTSVRWDSADLLSFFKTVAFNRSDFINLKHNLSVQGP